MTKRKGLFDIDVDVRGLLEGLPVSNSAVAKSSIDQTVVSDDSILISNALDVLTRH
ncbi:hypothetical protein [Peribacillus huizhouensis]|uniref:Uncharacterized protein n=1 Tax=Peribacillus huizhouensis TaxID=1501239 RepID=A0ABR6CL71_9BACI|nr:hypothetical protein [Peribacillus huizhouensis]MBA9025784.1 hypothetical protein [Peribacillus huizhouensis]